MKYYNVSFLGIIILIYVFIVSAEVSITVETDIDEDTIDISSDVKIDVEEDASSVDMQELLDINEDYIEEELNTIQEENIQDVDTNKDQLQYTPPSTFQITAHIQTNLHTGYSYFIPKESLSTSFAHLPFLECGAVGSTTEKLPLVSGVFRHTPHNAAQLPKRDESIDVVLENLDRKEVVEEKDDGVGNTLEGLNILDEREEEGSGINTTVSASKEDADQHPKRPSPPKYVVALSSMEITVGGRKNGNETQQFKAGDVIFVEDTWWGVWDNEEENESFDEKEDDGESDGSSSMKGYIMRASSESETEDMNILMRLFRMQYTGIGNMHNMS